MEFPAPRRLNRLAILFALRRAALAAGLAVTLLGTAGCRTYATKTQGALQAWRAGQVGPALAEFTARAEKSGDRDAVIWRLEQATALRLNGQFEESNRAFADAEKRMAEYAARAKVRVATETMAAATTPANLPYEGRSYDKIMAATYRALNCMALGDLEAARTALFQAYQYQQDAVAENARRIERAQEEAAARGDSSVIERTRQNPQFGHRVDSLYQPLSALQPYAEYVNPFTVWLDGVYFLTQAQDASDLERARKSFERVLAFYPNHPFARADLEMAERRLRGEPLDAVTYVVFATGSAPIRERARIDIPIVFANVSYIGTAWPVLRPVGGHAATLGVSAGSLSMTTEQIASMDRIIAQDFENELPAIITRTLVSTLAKGAAAFAVNEAASQQDAGLGAIVRLATLAYQASVNIADTRTWTTLPKEFQIARFPTPPDRRVVLQEGASPPLTVVLGDGLIHLVYVRSVSGHTPLRVSQIRLR